MSLVHCQVLKANDTFSPLSIDLLDGLKPFPWKKLPQCRVQLPCSTPGSVDSAYQNTSHPIVAQYSHQSSKITGAANLLFQNYLFNRQQYVEYNGATSQKLKISTGVPQGSILGPLLFFIYINDLPSVSNVLQMLMYADDTTLYCNFNSINNVNRINEELCKVSVWLSANKLALNVAKTKYIM